MSAPIYLYIAGTAGVVALGIMQWATGTLPPYTPSQSADEMLIRPGEALGLLLVLRAFSSGAVALTGIEAISNGVPYFQPPEARNAHRTLAGLAIAFGGLMVAVISAVLIVLFHGSVTALVPLFTVGAFATFTLSQAGIARHWWRHRDRRWQWHLAANALGAITTTGVLAIVVVSKFVYGAWIVVLIPPLLVLAFHTVGVHHERLTRALHIGSAQAVSRVLATPMRHHVVITVGRLDRVALQAVRYARGINAQIEAVYVTDDRARRAKTCATGGMLRWSASPW